MGLHVPPVLTKTAEQVDQILAVFLIKLTAGVLSLIPLTKPFFFVASSTFTGILPSPGMTAVLTDSPSNQICCSPVTCLTPLSAAKVKGNGFIISMGLFNSGMQKVTE